MQITKNAKPSRRVGRRILAVAGVTACAVSAGLVTAAPASAASRGFTVTNNSNATLRLEGLNHQKKTVCAAPIAPVCAHGNYPMEFEGRSEVGAEIAPGGSQRFELKDGFDIFPGIQYAAQMTYKIEQTNAKLEVWIDTTPTTNNSRCEVVPASAGRCTAGGLAITFTR